jgi:hypothetical protein
VTLEGSTPSNVVNSCTPASPATSCINTLNAACPVGTVPVGCGVFMSSVCPDGSNGVSDSYFNSSNGCTVQVYNRTAVGACGALLFTLQVQVKCINVPQN